MSLSQSHEVPAPIADDVHEEHHGGAHAVPRRILIGVYAALLICTALTVTVSTVDLGNLNIIVALGVAVVKASLVLLFFMHLRWDSPFNAIIIITAIFFVALFIGIAMMDSYNYQENMTPPVSVHVQ